MASPREIRQAIADDLDSSIAAPYSQVYADEAARVAVSISLAIETRVEMTTDTERAELDELLSGYVDEFDTIVTALLGF